MKILRQGLLAVLLALTVAISCSEKKSQKIPQDIEKDLFQANQDFLNRKFDTALENTEKIIKAHSAYLPAAVLKGKILFFTKKYKESQKVFSEVLKQEPGHQGALLWSARIAMLDKKTEKEAEQYLLHGLNNQPEDFVMHMELARFHTKTGNLRQAMLEYQKLIATELELANAYRNYEALLLQHKLVDRAEKIKAKRMALESAKAK